MHVYLSVNLKGVAGLATTDLQTPTAVNLAPLVPAAWWTRQYSASFEVADPTEASGAVIVLYSPTAGAMRGRLSRALR